MDEFIWRALIGGIGIAAVAGPLGCFVVWRRMAFFGDALAHSALLGVALGFLAGVSPMIGVVILCLVFAALLVAIEARARVAHDTLIGIFAHGALSLGLVALAFMERLRVDLIGLLFGDVLAVTRADVAAIYLGGAVVIAGLAMLWRPLLASTVHEDLARVDGHSPRLLRLALIVLLAVVVAIAMRIVGVMLITAMLIVPAAAARRLARTPEAMAIGAALLGALAVIAGIMGSLAFDTPSGPSIVVAAITLFAAILLLPRPAR